MKRLFTLLFFVLYTFSNVCFVSAEVDVSAHSAIVIDASSKRVLFEKDAHTKRGMASTTKIMTALIAIEEASPDDIVTVSPHAAGVEGSSIWLEVNEHISVHDLLYGLMLASGNDAATALAEHIAGSEEAFTLLMNRKAREIGAYNTNFTNPHGLPDENHYTTAYDLALIAAEAMKNKVFREIVATENKTISWENSQWDRSLTNHNKLLKRYEYATGIKTGFTKKDGRCLVSSAEKDGKHYITVTLSAPDDWNDHIQLFEHCFDSYSTYSICKKGALAANYSDAANNADQISMVYAEDFSFPVTDNEKNFIRTQNTYDVVYPVKKGQTVGRCDVYFSDKQVGSVCLLAANDSEIKKNMHTIFINLLKGLMMQ